MTAAERVKEALHLLELVDDELRGHEGEYDFAHSILQDAVYCQSAINTIVWRCNKVNNPELEPYEEAFYE